MAGRAFPQPRRSFLYSGVQLEAKAIKSETEEAINDEDPSHYLSLQAVSQVIGRIREYPCSQMSIHVGKQEQARDECLIKMHNEQSPLIAAELRARDYLLRSAASRFAYGNFCWYCSPLVKKPISPEDRTDTKVDLEKLPRSPAMILCYAGQNCPAGL